MGEADARGNAASGRRERFLAAARTGAPGTASWAPPDLVTAWIEVAPGPARIRPRAGQGAVNQTLESALHAGLEAGVDAVTLPLDARVLARGLGADVDDQGRLMHPVRARADLDRLDAPDPIRALADVAQALRTSGPGRGEGLALIVEVPAPWSLAWWLAGNASPDDELVGPLQELIADALLPWIGLLVESGADGIHLGDPEAADLDGEAWRGQVRGPLERVVCGAKALGVPVLLDAGDRNGSLAHLPESGADVLVLGFEACRTPEETLSAIGGRTALAIPGPSQPDADGAWLSAWAGARGLLITPRSAATPAAAAALLARREGSQP